MSLTKQMLAEEVATQVFMDKITRAPNRVTAMKAVETLIELMKKGMENGEDVLISGFGKFRVRNKKERKGRNPATGERMMLKERRVVTFQCSGILRNKINRRNS